MLSLWKHRRRVMLSRQQAVGNGQEEVVGSREAEVRGLKSEVRRRSSEIRFACHSCEFHPNTVVPPYGAGGVKKSEV